MQSSLGIYIEENIIKYAKLQKDKEFTEKLNDIKEAKQKRNEKIKIDIE